MSTHDESKSAAFDALAPVAGAWEVILNAKAPEKARDLVKRVVEVGEKLTAGGQVAVEKATTTAEDVLLGSVRESAKATRAVGDAVFQEAEAMFVGLGKLSSATSLTEAFHIQTEFLRARSDAAAKRMKAVADYVDEKASAWGVPAPVKAFPKPEKAKAA
jgi:hypothetical protein